MRDANPRATRRPRHSADGRRGGIHPAALSPRRSPRPCRGRPR
ncbi:MAG: hypothetical protein WC483_05000 [Candidatus Paceibacterota bacterium]